jgi:hypothetical protein
MKNLKTLTLIVFLLSGELAFGQDEEVWMYGWRPAETQTLYDSYMQRLYVTKPYLQENYEKDVFDLYSRLQNYKKLSDYCQGKAKDWQDKKRILNVKGAYQAWKEENKEYIQLINSLWVSLVKDIKNNRVRELVVKLEEQNKSSLPIFERSDDDDAQCKKVYLKFGREDQSGKITGRESEDKRFSDAYRNIDFYMHPEKKEAFIKVLKKQLDAGLSGERACKKSGGSWQPVGMRQSMACITKYPDAGKSCTDDSQCKGGCIAVTPIDHQGVHVGRCKTDDDITDCSTHLIKGHRNDPVSCFY